MIAQKGDQDLSVLPDIPTLVVGGKPPIFALVKRMLEARSNLKIIGHWNSDESSTFAGRAFPKAVQLVFLVVDHMGTVQKESVLQMCRQRGIGYIIGQRKFSTMSMHMEALGIKLVGVTGRIPQIPAPTQMSKMEAKNYEEGKKAFQNGEKRKAPHKRFSKTWLRGYDEARQDLDEQERLKQEEEKRQEQEKQQAAEAKKAQIMPEMAPPTEPVVEPGATPTVESDDERDLRETRELEEIIEREDRDERQFRRLVDGMALRIQTMMRRGKGRTSRVLIQVTISSSEITYASDQQKE